MRYVHLVSMSVYVRYTLRNAHAYRMLIGALRVLSVYVRYTLLNTHISGC